MLARDATHVTALGARHGRYGRDPISDPGKPGV